VYRFGTFCAVKCAVDLCTRKLACHPDRAQDVHLRLQRGAPQSLPLRLGKTSLYSMRRRPLCAMRSRHSIRCEQCDYHVCYAKTRMRKLLLSSTLLIFSALSSGQVPPDTTGYASTPANAMQFAVHAKIEFLGP